MHKVFEKFINYIFWVTISFLIGMFLASQSVKAFEYAFDLELIDPIGNNLSNEINKIFTKGESEDLSIKNLATASAYLSTMDTQKEVDFPKWTSLVFVGDIMLSRNVEKSVEENFNGDFSFLFAKIKPVIEKKDIVFGNLEGPISDQGDDMGNLYSFRMKPEALLSIKNVGFDALSVANNHIGDWGRIAIDDTIFRLKNEGIIPVGGGYNKNDAEDLRIIEKNGLNFGFLGFNDIPAEWARASDREPGILIVDNDFTETIKNASQKADILIVSIHFGEEYRILPSERQKRLARDAIDNGAKIVVGHHPHVIQPVERYNDGIIAYSLGNFIFDQNFSKETMEGLMLGVVISDDKEIKSISVTKTKLNSLFQPEP